MTNLEFTLVLEGLAFDREILDALFEAGCDDATFGEVDGVGFADFSRDGGSPSEVISEAIRQIESVPGLWVRRVEPDDLVTASEIAGRLGRSRESVRLLIAGERGPGGFPSPVSHLRSRSRLWRWSDVARWFRGIDPDGAELERATFVAAVNEALELRHLRTELGKDEDREVMRLIRVSVASRASHRT